jgi:hypothetical protein
VAGSEGEIGLDVVTAARTQRERRCESEIGWHRNAQRAFLTLCDTNSHVS